MRYAPIPTVSLAAAVLLSVSSLDAQQGRAPAEDSWGHWRGPSQTGVAAGAAPVRWSDSSNVVWKVEIPGRGHSSPVIWGDRIFITTAIPTGNKADSSGASASEGGRRSDGGAGAHQEHRFEVLALDRATGKMIWRQTAATAVPHEGYHATYGSFASNSPTTDGQRVYASFGSRGLFAYDMSGTLVWQRDFKIQMRMFQEFGEGVGPVLDDGRLIVLSDHEGDGFLAMLRRQRVALVVADTAGKFPHTEEEAADFMYLRLHGDTELYVSGYGDEALDGWAERIQAWRRQGDVYCYFDNDAKVHAPFDAGRLMARLGA